MTPRHINLGSKNRLFWNFFFHVCSFELYIFFLQEGLCQYAKDKVVAVTKTVTTIRSGNEDELKALVASKGPVVVNLNTDATFKSYK